MVISMQLNSQVIDRIVGQVGGEIILMSEVEGRITYLEETYGEMDKETRCLVIEDLLSTKLLVNQAKIDSVLVLDEEVEAQIDARISRILTMMGNDERRFEQEYGKTVEEVRRDQRENIKNQMLSERMQSQVMESVIATPTEVINYYKKLPKDSLPYFNAEVEVSELVYTPPFNEIEKQKAYERITTYRDRALEGESFAELAATYSDDPGSAKNGGKLGMMPRGTFVPEFEAVAYNLEPGEISQVVETQFGYHVIKLLERRGNMINTQHILIKPEQTQEDIDKAIQLLDSLKDMVLIDSLPFSEIVKKYGDEDVRSYTNGGRMVNPKSGTNFFEISDLDPDVYFTIDTLEPGDISSPQEFSDYGLEAKIKMFFLHSRTRPHQASLEKDYSRIRELASQYKKGVEFEKWIKEKISDTYVFIDTEYIDCSNINKTWLKQEQEQAKRP
jgi:peptidyl-prolyl cis-trans isomerase SurA